jgi:hypothetical protein
MAEDCVWAGEVGDTRISISEMMAKDPKSKSTHLRVRVIREDGIGVTLGDTEHVLSVADAKALSDALLAKARETVSSSKEIADLNEAKAWFETKLAEADKALMDIRRITGTTHTGTPRAYTALSQIDQLARKALA